MKVSTVNLFNVQLKDIASGSSTQQVEGAKITEPPKLPTDKQCNFADKNLAQYSWIEVYD